MKQLRELIVLAFLLVGGIASLTPASSLAAEQDYRFELVDQAIHMGHDVRIAVHLLRVSGGKTVANATITGLKLQMLMGSMTMPAEIKALAPDANGNYRLAADLMMAGDWQLDLSAAVAGQQEPVHGTLKFQVVK